MALISAPVSFENTSYFGVVSCFVLTKTEFEKIIENDINNVFLDTAVFGENALYTHKTGEIVTYRAIFTDSFNSADTGTSTASGRNVVIKIQESKLKRYPTRNDLILIRGIKYCVDDYQPDGVGMVSLFLDRYKHA